MKKYNLCIIINSIISLFFFTVGFLNKQSMENIFEKICGKIIHIQQKNHKFIYNYQITVTESNNTYMCYEKSGAINAKYTINDIVTVYFANCDSSYLEPEYIDKQYNNFVYFDAVSIIFGLFSITSLIVAIISYYHHKSLHSHYQIKNLVVYIPHDFEEKMQLNNKENYFPYAVNNYRSI